MQYGLQNMVQYGLLFLLYFWTNKCSIGAHKWCLSKIQFFSETENSQSFYSQSYNKLCSIATEMTITLLPFCSDRTGWLHTPGSDWASHQGQSPRRR